MLLSTSSSMASTARHQRRSGSPPVSALPGPAPVSGLPPPLPISRPSHAAPPSSDSRGGGGGWRRMPASPLPAPAPPWRYSSGQPSCSRRRTIQAHRRARPLHPECGTSDVGAAASAACQREARNSACTAGEDESSQASTGMECDSHSWAAAAAAREVGGAGGVVSSAPRAPPPGEPAPASPPTPCSAWTSAVPSPSASSSASACASASAFTGSAAMTSSTASSSGTEASTPSSASQPALGSGQVRASSSASRPPVPSLTIPGGTEAPPAAPVRAAGQSAQCAAVAGERPSLVRSSPSSANAPPRHRTAARA
mmetsp:Transcript_28484/g.91989  ORF Transcript_28484/g.91989 Transcript_28484/m.91989 type:complete len:312 (-) Transcript_28484:437-1372(-)